MTEILNKEFSRNSFLKGSGALVVGFSLAGATSAAAGAASAPTEAGYNPPLNRLDSWLRVNADNTINLLTSEGEVGQGISTGFMMVAAEELEVDLSQMIYGTSARNAAGQAVSSANDTYVVAQTGGIGGSNSMSRSGPRIRAAAVAARAELLKLASTQLGTPVASLTVSKGVVTGGGRSVTYGELLGGKLFNVTLTTTSLQPGVAPAKPVSQYKLVGTAAPRVDIPAKVRGETIYVHNIKLPGMLHGRLVRPGQGPFGTDGFAKPLKVDASSIAHLKDVRVIQVKDFLGVVGPVEYQVVQAAAQLKVTWAENPILPGHGNLFDSFRKADAAGKMPARITDNSGNFDVSFKAAAKTVSASFKYPYNSHLPIGPACAVADYKNLGGPDKDMVTVFSNTQNIASTSTGLQSALKLARPSQARTIFYEGSSSFGNGYHYLDINDSAAILSREANAPVRLQLMRWDEQGWNKYGPAIMLDIRAGVDDKGIITAYEAVAFAQAGAGTSAARQLIGVEAFAAEGASGTNEENLAPMYKVAQTGRRLIAKTQTRAMGTFQNGALRAPSGPQSNWASEQIVDMLAESAGKDPHSFRVQNMRTDGFGPSGEWPRYIGVLNAAVEASGYKPHVAASQLGSGKVVSGWGMAIGTHNDSYAATVAHVTVNKETGKITVNHLWSAQDAGFAINPGLLMNQMSGNLVMGASKTLHEQLMFDKKRVTSRDWVTYPILRFKETPKVTTVVVNRTDRTPHGSGEPPLVPTGAAIANAVYDATGVRMTQAPLTPSRVRGFLSGAK
jgi:CO/xanthine dehydrogenase Mo-binding subunit